MATPGETELLGDVSGLRARIRELEKEVALLRGAPADNGEAVALYHLMDDAPVGFVFFDTELRFQALNRTLAEINGLPPHEHIGRLVDELIPSLAPRIRQAFQYVLATGKPLLNGLASGETPSAPGQLRHWSASWYPMRSPDGRLLGVGGVVTEITRHRKIEDALRTSLQNLELAQVAAGIGTYDFDIATSVGRCSEHWRPLYGLPPSEFGPPHEEWAALIHPEDRERLMEGARLQIEEGIPCDTEFRVIWPDGSLHWLFTKGCLVRDAHGKPTRTVGVTMDITERKRAEAALRESEERFRNLADSAPTMIWTSARDHRIDFANKFTLNFTGRTMEDLTAQGWTEVHPEDWDRLRSEWTACVSQHQTFHSEYRMRRADGEYRWMLGTGTSRFLENGDYDGYVGIAVDITAHKHAEHRLRELSTALMRIQDQERRRIGRELHDSTGQNLAALKLNLSRLSHANLPSELEKLVPESMALTERMLIEIRTLSYLLHPPLLDELGLISALKTYIDGFSGRSGIPVHFEAPPDFGRLAPELETAIFRIVQEGLTNAHRHSSSSQCWVAIQTTQDTISLMVRDDGVGLPATLRQLQNEPGLVGVGLSGMQERARQLGGTLDIESDGGCVIRAAFPLTRP
ncbi:MAG TPA: PAS domain-containing protein [Bryobacteraceae bacterium]|nr:PAS domain-containing protein [Bryobacteraceae bacterium]